MYAYRFSAPQPIKLLEPTKKMGSKPDLAVMIRFWYILRASGDRKLGKPASNETLMCKIERKLNIKGIT